MKNYAFFPESISFVKNKAKQLKKAFPGLKTSISLETTAVALGFKNWFDCTQKLKEPINSISRYDEDISQDDFHWRRHFQFCTLVEIGKIPANCADEFVRYWQLTSKSGNTLIKSYSTLYSYFKSESSASSEERELYKNTKDFLSTQDTKKICDGVFLGVPLYGKNAYYALDLERINSIPFVFRGSNDTFLEYESGEYLPLFIDELRTPEKEKKALSYLGEHEPLLAQYYCEIQGIPYTGKEVKETLLDIREKSLKNPDKWFALSLRTADPHETEVIIPALKGDKFADLFELKNELHLDDIQWFQMSGRKMLEIFITPSWDTNSIVSSIMFTEQDAKKCPPQFHSPFKSGFMREIEYNPTIESNRFLIDDELDLDTEPTPTMADLDDIKDLSELFD